ncbi:MAG TPA: TlpA disulfide reductase family protein [Pirellulales bacterium]
MEYSLKDMMTGKNQGMQFAIREQELDRRKCLKPRPGFRWIQEPQPRAKTGNWAGWYDHNVKVSFDQNSAQAFVVNTNRSAEVFSLQVVAFDEREERYELDGRAVGAYGRFIAESFRLDPAQLPPDRVKYVGIEGVTRQDQAAVARRLAQLAEAEGNNVLPLPKIDEPFDFVLTAGNRRIESAQLRGKVVVIDLWASWCAPCLKLMPEMKELYAQWHDKGLEVIGVSFDQDEGQAQAVIDRMQLPWPSSTLPADCTARKLWDSREGVTYLPTLLVVDAQGILRMELVNDAQKLAKCVEGLLSTPSTPAVDGQKK